MMQVSHWSSGALLGKLAPNPPAAVALGVASHFVLDKVPHYWPASAKAQWWFTAADYAGAIAMIGVLVAAGIAGRHAVLWGVAGSAAVDIVLVGVAPVRTSALGRWHSRRQPHRREPSWLWTDAVVSATCVALIVLV